LHFVPAVNSDIQILTFEKKAISGALFGVAGDRLFLILPTANLSPGPYVNSPNKNEIFSDQKNGRN